MKLEHLIDQAAGQPKKTVAVAVAEDHEVIEAVAKAITLQLNFNFVYMEIKKK